jgi:hypothetical protein
VELEFIGGGVGEKVMWQGDWIGGFDRKCAVNEVGIGAIDCREEGKMVLRKG